jgi:hypothetical protein
MATVATRSAVPTRLRESEELTRIPSGNLLGGLRIRTGCPYPPARGPPIALVATWLKDPGGSMPGLDPEAHAREVLRVDLASESLDKLQRCPRGVG